MSDAHGEELHTGKYPSLHGTFVFFNLYVRVLGKEGDGGGNPFLPRAKGGLSPVCPYTKISRRP